eukprot:c38654_g1_i1 orf=3-170(-)
MRFCSLHLWLLDLGFLGFMYPRYCTVWMKIIPINACALVSITALLRDCSGVGKSCL